MENPYKRKKEPELNKQVILDAAAEIGATADWHQVTFQAIADKTGLSKGGIIHHFRNKEELLDELVRQSLAELTEWIQEEKKSTNKESSSMSYLRFVVKKSDDLHYQRVMKIIMQAVLINEHYRKGWDEWFSSQMDADIKGDENPNNLIIALVADGLWYAGNLGVYNISKSKKQQIVDKLQHL